MPAPFTFGTAPRNSVIGPGYATLDLGRCERLENRARGISNPAGEFFNALNKANYDLPNRIFGTANFARIFSAKSPGEMQFGAKFAF